METTDSYLTLARPAEASSRERSSKFLSFAYPVENEEQIREALDALRKRFYDATHHCYAWIAAYKEAAQEVLAAGEKVERTVDTRIEVRFSYLAMNDVMRIVKEEQPRIANQQFDNLCTMTLTIRRSKAEGLAGKLRKVEGAEIEIAG